MAGEPCSERAGLEANEARARLVRCQTKERVLQHVRLRPLHLPPAPLPPALALQWAASKRGGEAGRWARRSTAVGP